jgi:hypothetical protein
MLLMCLINGDKLSAYPTLNIHYPIDSVELTVSYKLHIANYLSITYLIYITDVFGKCEDVIILQGNSMVLNIPSVNNSNKVDDPI